MDYKLLTGNELTVDLNFLDSDVRDKIKKHSGWVIIGQNDDKEIITIAAFVFDEVRRDTVELSYIYTRPDEREKGWAMGLIYYAQKLFAGDGIKRFICCPTGTMDELMDFSGFLGMAGFEPLELDWHVYHYNREKMLNNKALQPYMNVEESHFVKMSQNEIRYYMHADDMKLPMRMRDNIMRDCDPDNSLFAVENGKIVAAVLGRNDSNSEADILNIYIYPAWKKKQYILAMLAILIKRLPDSVKYISLAIDSERVRALYAYTFGNPDEDFWVQCYERELSENEEL